MTLLSALGSAMEDVVESMAGLRREGKLCVVTQDEVREDYVGPEIPCRLTSIGVDLWGDEV